MVPTSDDNTTELSEYFIVIITYVDKPEVVVIGLYYASSVTIVDNEQGNAKPCDTACVCQYVRACMCACLHMWPLLCVHAVSVCVWMNRICIAIYSNSFIAAIKVRFDPSYYNVMEGDVAKLTLVTDTNNYEFNFIVTLRHMDGSATASGEGVFIICYEGIEVHCHIRYGKGKSWA